MVFTAPNSILPGAPRSMKQGLTGHASLLCLCWTSQSHFPPLSSCQHTSTLFLPAFSLTSSTLRNWGHKSSDSVCLLLLLFSHSVMSNSLQPQGLQYARLLCPPWDFPGKNTRVAISFSRGSSQTRDLTRVSCISRWILYHWATREALIPYIQTM